MSGGDSNTTTPAVALLVVVVVTLRLLPSLLRCGGRWEVMSVCWLWLLVWLWFVAPWLTLKLACEPLTQLLVGDIGEEEELGGVGWFRLLFVIWLWLWVWVVEGTVGACWWEVCEERLLLDR